jgi:hypothetical protein
MCLAVYVAADAPLPQSRWREAAPAFYLEEVPESEGVRKQFRYRHVYYAGSHEGCGCGFSKDGRDPAELEKCQETYSALAAVLSAHARRGVKIELFTCWEGEQTVKPEERKTIAVEQLSEPEFELKELALLSVHNGT